MTTTELIAHWRAEADRLEPESWADLDAADIAEVGAKQHALRQCAIDLEKSINPAP